MFNRGPFHNKRYRYIEKIQRRAARFILNNYSWNTSVTQLLQKLNLPSLKSRRTCQKAIMIYKIVHSLVIPSTFQTRHHQYCFSITHLYSFFPAAIRIWNNLSSCTINSSSLDTFKKSHNLYIFVINCAFSSYEACTVILSYKMRYITIYKEK